MPLLLALVIAGGYLRREMRTLLIVCVVGTQLVVVSAANVWGHGVNHKLLVHQDGPLLRERCWNAALGSAVQAEHRWLYFNRPFACPIAPLAMAP
jgi:hypothetical protein